MATAQCYKSVGTVFLVNDLRRAECFCMRICVCMSMFILCRSSLVLKEKVKATAKMLKTKQFFLGFNQKNASFLYISFLWIFFLSSSVECVCFVVVAMGAKQDENITLSIHKQTPANRIHV